MQDNIPNHNLHTSLASCITSQLIKCIVMHSNSTTNAPDAKANYWSNKQPPFKHFDYLTHIVGCWMTYWTACNVLIRRIYSKVTSFYYLMLFGYDIRRPMGPISAANVLLLVQLALLSSVGSPGIFQLTIHLLKDRCWEIVSKIFTYSVS